MRSCCALLIGAALGCGSARAACGPAEFAWNDQRCSAPLPDGAPASCTEVGDGKSYLRCSADCECPASAAECATLGLFNGGDFACNASVRICMATARHDCPP